MPCSFYLFYTYYSLLEYLSSIYFFFVRTKLSNFFALFVEEQKGKPGAGFWGAVARHRHPQAPLRSRALPLSLFAISLCVSVALSVELVVSFFYALFLATKRASRNIFACSFWVNYKVKYNRAVKVASVMPPTGLPCHFSLTALLLIVFDNFARFWVDYGGVSAMSVAICLTRSYVFKHIKPLIELRCGYLPVLKHFKE